MINCIAIVLGLIMEYFFRLCNNYGITIILLTLFLKIILFPLNILVQKNSIKMIKIKPELEELKIKYSDDKDKFMEEEIELFKREKYHSLIGIIPLIIQIIILMGLTRTLSNSAIYLKNISKFNFFGFDFNQVPNLKIMNYNSLIVIIIFITTLLLCYIQNKENVLQVEESRKNQIITTVLTLGITVYFSIYVPVGVSFYWSLGNIISIFQLYLLNYMYNPKKYINYDKLEKINCIIKERQDEENKNKLKEKEDYKRFLDYGSKEIVFYSEANGFYKYFEPMIKYILNNSNLEIHYITSDANDNLLKNHHDRLFPYYINTNKLIPLFMKMDSDIVVMTTPDLQNFYLKRSMVRNDVEYIFTDHGLGSCNLMYREGALDYFDTIFATNKQQVDEIRAIEILRNKKKKKIIETGYCLIDEMMEKYNSFKKIENDKKTIIIAPSWQEDNIMDSCIEEILDNCLNKDDIRIIVRPHPQYLKHNPIRMKYLFEKYKEKFNEDFIIQQEFSDIDSVFKADLVITDWSGIGYEFSLVTAKPSLFINTKIKIINPQYDEIDVKPLDIGFRNVIGKSIEKNEINKIYNSIIDLINSKEKFESVIEKTRKEYLFNIGNVAKMQGEYIIERVKENKK